MVSFFDPIQNIELSYHIDKNLKDKWDKLTDGSWVKKDEDRVYIVDGRERTGKSVFTFQQAKYLDRNFNLSRVCFTPEEFLRAIRNAKKGEVVVFDEAFRGLSSKASQSKVNKAIVQALMEMGQRNLIVFIVLPTIFLLEMYPAVLRSNALFHIYKSRKGRRKFRIYNYSQKSLLYNVGKKRGFSYKFPRVRARGEFYGHFAIEEQSYRNKKEESFHHNDFVKEEEEGRMSKERKIALVNWFLALKHYEKTSQNKFIKVLSGLGINFSQPQMANLMDEVRKKGFVITYQ